MPVLHSDNNDDFLKQLEDELASTCMPKVHDYGKATTEDIVKDIHKILTGNGGPTRGIIFKLASANVNIKNIKSNVGVINTALTDQVTRCDKVQAATATRLALESERLDNAKSIGRALWNNKAIIVVLVALGFIYYNYLTEKQGSIDVIKERVDSAIAAKVLDLDKVKSDKTQ